MAVTRRPLNAIIFHNCYNSLILAKFPEGLDQFFDGFAEGV